MKTFKVTITRTDEYEIQVDEKIWTEDEIKEWGKTFWGDETHEDLAKSLARAWMKNDNNYFKEGFGYVKELNRNGEIKPYPYRKENGELGYPMPEDQYTKGLSIKPIVEDDDYDIEIES